MSHYRTGTINVTNGSTSVVGVGTDFIAGAAIGECLVGPDSKLYEIASIQSATGLTLGTGYLGSTVTGQTYSIIPTQSYIRDLALQAATLVNGMQSVVSNAGAGKFADGTVGSPGIQFTSDSNTGIRRTGADAVAVVTGGVDRLTISSTGAMVATGALTVNGAFTTSSTARLPAVSIGVDTDVYVYESATNALTVRAGGVGTEKYTTFGADGTLVVLNGGITANGNSTLGDSETGDTHAIKGATTLLASSASAALTVTQTGAGNAFVVEDSASTDSTPFVIDAGGRAITGYTASVPVLGVDAGIQNWASLGYMSSGRFSADAFSAWTTFVKSRNATVGGQTIVQSGDDLGNIAFTGSDGTGFIQGARITAAIDGTPGTNAMPGRLVFSTTADGASSPTEHMRIDSAGNVGIGAASTLGYTIWNAKNMTGGSTTVGQINVGTIQSDCTANASMYMAQPSTAAASFTLPLLVYYNTYQSTFGAGSAVTSQIGFRAQASMIGATTNYAFQADNTAAVTSGKTAYGFYSAVNAATGGGTTYGFYAAGTAANYFGGNVTVGGGGTLGYGAGSGGTVTQATSKATAVTLNKPSGQITMAADSLAAGASALFLVNNTAAGASDSIVANVSFLFAKYDVEAGTPGVGSFYLRVTNITGGSLSEAPVINFNVIKGSAS